MNGDDEKARRYCDRSAKSNLLGPLGGNGADGYRRMARALGPSAKIPAKPSENAVTIAASLPIGGAEK
jgi:hypothetical protein